MHFVRTIRKRWALAFFAGSALGLAGTVLWCGPFTNWVAARIERAAGKRATVGSVSLGWRCLIVGDTKIFGAAPFDSEPLVRIDRLIVKSGSSAIVEGVDIQYLSVGGLDNVDGSRHGTSTAAGPKMIGKLQDLMVRDGRISAIVQPVGAGPRMAFRAGNFSLSAPARGPQRLEIDNFALDVQGVATLRIPALAVERQSSAAAVALRASGASLHIPGAGALAGGIEVVGSWMGDEGDLRVQAGPALLADVHMDGQGARANLRLDNFPLRPLRPSFERWGIDVQGGRADVRANVMLEGRDRRAPFDVAIALRGLGIHNPAVDNRSWDDVTANLAARGSMDLASGRLDVEFGQTVLLGLPLAFAGWADLSAPARGSVQVRTPGRNAPACAAILAAQPDPVQDALRGLRLAGNLDLEANMTFDASNWENLALDFSIKQRCKVLSEPEALSGAMSALARMGTSPRLPLPGRDFSRLVTMPSHLRAAFVTAEDGRFYKHRGFDLENLRRALAYDLEVGAFARGASTITQQLAKNLFLVPDRTLARKLQEIVFTWRLDERLSKDRILELYLNAIELGPGIRGVGQAARAYFGKPPGELRPIESAHLAALTPNPRGLARRFRDGRVDEGWLRRLYDLLAMMKRSGRISTDELAAARAGRLTLKKI